MENYNLAPEAYNLQRKLGMKDVRYLIYADLRATGWSMRNAWMIAFNGTGASWSKNTLEREINKLESLESVQRRIADIKGENEIPHDGELSPEELAKETSKEKILTDLVMARRKVKEGTKEWGEYTKMIADYTKIKQDELQTEDNTIHYFLPARYPTKCSECLLYKGNKSKNK